VDNPVFTILRVTCFLIFFAALGTAIGIIVGAWFIDAIRNGEKRVLADLEKLNPLPGCIVCQNTRVPIKAKGKCKRCYERIGGRERRARAKSSSKR